MKTHFEPEDIQAIAQAVTEMIKPLLSARERTEDTILTPEGLAKYLQVDTSWVYKQVSLKTIPYFKSGKYTRFKKAAIDKWIDTQTRRPLTPFKLTKIAG